LVTVESWTPEWLGCDPDTDPFDRAFCTNPDRLAPRRLEAPLPVDPAMSRFIDEYRTPGQREAIRAALGQPAGTTLTVNLPTGTGKTYAIVGPALAHPGLTVVVVPTTALAIDQEKRLQELLARFGTPPRPYAYHGEMSDDAKAAFREDMRSGAVRLVFTSPEALATGLRHTVLRLATENRLRTLAIDEAHIVEEWGSNFRPDFQMISGLRREIIELQRTRKIEEVRTLLLTGTLTEACLKVLHSLFGETDRHEVVASMGTRPEISYWAAPVDDDHSRRLERLEETLRHCAKPCIVYVTRRHEDEGEDPVLHVQGLVTHLKQRGFTRIAGVDGGTSNTDKLALIEGMSGDDDHTPRVDIAVANSAFGLGIDIDGLRTVIHACVPESVERLYQEAGRAGRDGREAVHVWLPTGNDWRLARRMATTKLPETQMAERRWTAMRAAGTVEDGVYTVDLDTTHDAGVSKGSYNRAWNQRVLTLMARAGMLSIEGGDDAPPPDPGLMADVESSFSSIQVRPLEISESKWKELDGVRSEQHESDQLSLEHLEQLGSAECINKVFQTAFTIRPLPQGILGYGAIVSNKACAGCPQCRRNGREPTNYTPGIVSPSRLLGDSHGRSASQLVLYDRSGPHLPDYAERFMEIIVGRGVTHVVLDTSWKSHDPWRLHPILFKQLPSLNLRPDIFVDMLDTETRLFEVLDYGRPMILFPPVGTADDQSREIPFLSDFITHNGQFPVPYIVVAPRGLFLDNGVHRGPIEQWPHLRLETDSDLERFGVFQ
jgi:superfamily II DNA/RNA helicase